MSRSVPGRHAFARRLCAGVMQTCLGMAASTAAWSATLLVNSQLDPGTGGCTAGECTLREAIVAANATAAADTINFSFSTGVGPEVMIQPASALPTITQPLTINGYSVAGAAVNTHAARSDAVIRIRLDGLNAGTLANGLAVCADNVVIRGLAITNFRRAAIAYGLDSDNVHCAGVTAGAVRGNFIGVTTNGSTAGGNGVAGLFIDGAEVAIGSSSPADRNVISASTGAGIQVQRAGAAGSTVLGNLIGTDRSGRQPRGNGLAGLQASSTATLVTVGTTTAPNTIGFNDVGVRAPNGSSRITAFANRYLRNTEMGIDLQGSNGVGGVTANDDNDADSGGNSLQNFLDNFFATRIDGGIRVQGTLRRTATTSLQPYTIAAYSTTVCSPSGHGEGEFIGSAVVAVNAAVATIDLSISTANPPPNGASVSVTVTSPAGDTSEFSPCVALDPPPLVVTSTADTDGSSCGATCSLRQAINAANLNAAPKLITFAIPGNGELLIQPTSVLPTITTPVTIDGYSQPGASANTLEEGSDAVLRIRLDGALAGNVSGIAVCGNDTVVKGLAITRFSQSGITFGRETGGTFCTNAPNRGTVLGSFIGLATDGHTPAGNNGAGVVGFGVPLFVGSEALADRNVVAANTQGVVLINVGAAGSRILNNLIGTDRTGGLDRGNLDTGVTLGGGAVDSVIGNLAAPNDIRFNRAGIVGLNINAQRNRFGANRFASNDGLAIDLRAGAADAPGPTPNDSDDTDTGSNGLQNSPELEIAEIVDDGLRLRGRVELPPGTSNAEFILTAYASASCHASGFGEGETLLGEITVALSSGSDGRFDTQLANVGPLQAGSPITATLTGAEGTSEMSACLAAVEAAPGIVVTSAADPGSGGCTAGECTLREAITLANAQPGADLIRFDISGEGPFRITLQTALPAITEALTIDGYTQAGAAANAAEHGSDAILMVEIRGQPFAVVGISTCASDVLVRGLSLTGFSSAAVVTRADPFGSCALNGSNVRVEGSFLGLQPNGSSFANGIGIAVRNTQVQIGGAEPGQRNVISGNTTGVRFTDAGASGSRVDNNLFGTGTSTAVARPNSSAGIEIDGVSDVDVGGAGAQRNLFAFNGLGVLVRGGGSNNRLFNNEFVGNSGLAIDLAAGSTADGVTANDLNDDDTGANALQNAPQLSAVSSNADSVEVAGLLDVPSGLSTPTAYTLTFYDSANCDGSGRGEGEILIESRPVTFSSNAENFLQTLPLTPQAGRVITATATDPSGNTSEFSNCFAIPEPPRPPGIFANSFE